MWKHLKTVVLIAIGVAATSTPTAARFVEDWPYDKLFQKADLIVFASATKTEMVKDTLPGENSWNYELAAMNTMFKINHTLKGNIKSERIKVLHYKFGELKKGEGSTLIINGPRFVAFRTEPPAPEYLLFLKRLKDGRYEPVSGQIDPVDSVKEISVPSDNVLESK